MAFLHMHALTELQKCSKRVTKPWKIYVKYFHKKTILSLNRMSFMMSHRGTVH